MSPSEERPDDFMGEPDSGGGGNKRIEGRDKKGWSTSNGKPGSKRKKRALPHRGEEPHP